MILLVYYHNFSWNALGKFQQYVLLLLACTLSKWKLFPPCLCHCHPSMFSFASTCIANFGDYVCSYPFILFDCKLPRLVFWSLTFYFNECSFGYASSGLHYSVLLASFSCLVFNRCTSNFFQILRILTFFCHGYI